MAGIKQHEFKPKNGLAPEEIDWKKLEQLSGMMEAYLKKHGVEEAIVNGDRSKMFYVTGSLDGCKISGTGTLSATRHPETMRPTYHYKGLCNDKVLELRFNNYEFTDNDKKILTGEEPANIKGLVTDPKTKEQYYSVISLNPDTKEPVGYRSSAIQAPSHTKGVKWDDAMKQDYKDGKTVLVRDCQGKYGPYDAIARFDPYKKGLDFRPIKKLKQGQAQDGAATGYEKGKNEQQAKAAKQPGQNLSNDMKGKGQAQAGIKAEGPVADALKHGKEQDKSQSRNKNQGVKHRR